MHLRDPQMTAMKRRQDLCSPPDSGGSQEAILPILLGYWAPWGCQMEVRSLVKLTKRIWKSPDYLGTYIFQLQLQLWPLELPHVEGKHFPHTLQSKARWLVYTAVFSSNLISPQGTMTLQAQPDIAARIPSRPLRLILSDVFPVVAGFWIFYNLSHSVFIFPWLISLFWRLIWVGIYRLYNSPSLVTRRQP